MSDYKFSCPNCQQHLAGTEDWAGQMLNCPTCQKEFSVPPPPPRPATIVSSPPPPPPLSPIKPAGLRVASSTPPAAAGAAPPANESVNDLEKQVLDGGRFVIFQYCLSLILFTSKRPSKVVFIPAGQDGFWGAFTNSLVSLFFGWWSFPRGPFWTIGTIYRNARGGIDVTKDMLDQQLGPGRAAYVMAHRRVVPATSKRMRFFQLGLVAWVCLMGLFVAHIFNQALKPKDPAKMAPGEAQFDQANSRIAFNNGVIAFGNSPQAIAVAGFYATNMAILDKSCFTGGNPHGMSTSKHQYMVYCELHDSQCAIIVHVPELRHFTADAKNSLEKITWFSAQLALGMMKADKPGMSLAVGLRGAVLYDRVMVGKVVTEQIGDKKDSSLVMGLQQTFTGSGSENRLYSYFVNLPK